MYLCPRLARFKAEVTSGDICFREKVDKSKIRPELNGTLEWEMGLDDPMQNDVLPELRPSESWKTSYQ